MKKLFKIFVLALSVGTLMMAADAVAKDEPVTRPLKMMAQSQQVIDLTDGSLVAHADGVSSHLGQVAMDCTGFVDDPVFYGTIIAANGDLLNMEWELNSLLVTITPGTGRFEDAHGEFIMEIISSSQEVDPVAQTMTLSFVWSASGTITY